MKCSDLTQPILWTHQNGMKGLGIVAPPFSEQVFDWCNSFAFYGATIDVAGHLAGFNSIYETYQWGFFGTASSGMTVFGGSWPPTFVTGVNNRGQIVGQNAGYSEFTGSTVDTEFLGHATSWKEAGITAWDSGATDLGALGGAADLGYPFGYSSSANGVNDLGQVVGYSTTVPMYYDPAWAGWDGSVPIHAILWATSSGLSDLGTLTDDAFSAASKINLFGQVIGTSGNSAVFDQSSQRYKVVGRPFIWIRNSGMRELNTLIPPNSGWLLNTATDINIGGQIVGTGTHNGQTHGFLLTPRVF